MSTLVIDPEVFNSVAHTLYLDSCRSGDCTALRHHYPIRFGRTRIDVEHPEHPYQVRVIRLVRWMYWANLRSYAVRYRHLEGPAKYYSYKPYQPDHRTGRKLGDHELYKALQCIHYNIDFDSEWGEVLEQLIHAVAHRIVETSPEYEAAGWGQLRTNTAA